MEGKENISSNLITSCSGRNSFVKSEFKDSKQSSGLFKKSNFNRLLADAKNEIAEEIDEQLAFDTHINEVVGVASDWVRQENDYKVASELDRKYKYDYEKEVDNRLRAQAKDEKTAVALAMEERQQVLDHEKRKRMMEEKDYYYSQRLLIEEETQQNQIQELCEDDENLAKKIELQLQDEILAEELLEKERQQYDNYIKSLKDLEESDERVARLTMEQFNQENSLIRAQQAEHDETVARKLQEELDMNDQMERTENEMKDYLLSRKIYINSTRSEYCNKKRIEWITSPNYVPFKDLTSIKSMWVNTKTEIENVLGGLCISIILPNLKDLKINTKNSNKILIEATRMKEINDIDSNPNMSFYDAEFVIEGNNIKLNDNDINYEYSSETGLLHIFVDNVNLTNWNATKSNGESLLYKMKKSFKRFINRK